MVTLADGWSSSRLSCPLRKWPLDDQIRLLATLTISVKSHLIIAPHSVAMKRTHFVMLLGCTVDDLLELFLSATESSLQMTRAPHPPTETPPCMKTSHPAPVELSSETADAEIVIGLSCRLESVD